MQLHRCLMLIHFPSHEHTLYCWSSSPALRKPSAAAGTTVRREERGKYLLFVADCVFLSPLLSSLREAPCFCLPAVPRVAPALRDGKGQEEECEPGSGQHPGQGRTRRPCSALPCLSFFPLPHLPSSGSRLMGSLGWAAWDGQPPGVARPCFALQPAPAHFCSYLRANSAVAVYADALKLWLRSGLFLQINPLFYQI